MTGPVLLLDSEGSQAAKQRRLKWLANGRNLALDDLEFLYRMRSTAPLLDQPEQLEALLEVAREAEPTLIIIDPLIRFHRADENSASEMGPFLGQLRRLHDETGASIVAAHHLGKNVDGRPLGQALRGSSDFHGWFDSAIGVTRDEGELTLTFEARECEDQAPMTASMDIREAAGSAAIRPTGAPAYKHKKSNEILALLKANPEGMTARQVELPRFSGRFRPLGHATSRL